MNSQKLEKPEDEVYQSIITSLTSRKQVTQVTIYNHGTLTSEGRVSYKRLNLSCSLENAYFHPFLVHKVCPLSNKRCLTRIGVNNSGCD